MNKPQTLMKKYDDWMYLNAAAKALTDFRDWLAKSDLSCSGTPILRFGKNRDGQPQLLVDMTIAVPFQEPTNGTPLNGVPSLPVSSTPLSNRRNSRKSETTTSHPEKKAVVVPDRP